MKADQDSPPATASRLSLDARQRAMLEEMGIRLWLPQEASDEAEEAAITPPPNRPVKPEAQQAAAPRPQQALPQAKSAPPPVPPALAPVTQPLPAISMELDLPALRAAASQCQACRLCAGRQRSVWDAPPASLTTDMPRWLFVLDAPGAPENATGQPIQGDAGQLLMNMAAAVRLQPAQVYRAHATKCAPPPGHKVGQTELAQCAHWLRHEIARIQPQMVLAMGRHAAFSLLGSAEPLGQLRGHPHRMVLPEHEKETFAGLADIPVVVTYPPAYLLRNPSFKRQAWQDLCMAYALVQSQQNS